MNLVDTVAVTSRSFSKNEGLVNGLKAKYSKVIFNDSGATLQGQELINFLSLLELRSLQNLNARIAEYLREPVKKLMRAIGW